MKQTKKLKLVEVLVRDDRYGLEAPSDSDFFVSLAGLLTRYPIAMDDVDILLAPGYEVYGTNCNLKEKDGWEDLLDDIEDIADGFEDKDEYWCALVSDESGYALNGISASSFLLDLYPHPCMVARARLQATFPHEMGHLLGFGHSDCGDPDDVDPNLPPHTSELSTDVLKRELIPAGYGDLMSYCYHYNYQKRWPSLTLWNKLYDKLS